MSQSFDGLEKLAQKEGKISIRTLKPGDYVVFINARRSYLKLAAANNVIASRRMESGRFYDINCIRGVVQAFHNTGEIQYERVLRERLTTLLAKKSHPRKIEED